MLTSHFLLLAWHFETKKIELGPEKWEMGFKRGFSRLKVYPLIDHNCLGVLPEGFNTG